MKISLPLVPLSAVLIGCSGSTSNYACPAVLLPAIVVEVKDAQSGTPLAQGANGAVHDGAYVDSLNPFEAGSSLQAAFERPGTYTVEVQRTGYQAWTASDVRVTRQQCGVITVRLLATLVPRP